MASPKSHDSETTDEDNFVNDGALRAETINVSRKRKATSASEGPPLARKRQRVSQACDQCRSKKERCDGKRPACSSCFASNDKCTYAANLKKRGLRAGYVRVLEMLWGLMFCKLEGNEQLVRSFFRGAGGENHVEPLLAILRDGTATESLLKAGRESRVCDDIHRLLPFLEENENESLEVSGQRREGMQGMPETETLVQGGVDSRAIRTPEATESSSNGRGTPSKVIDPGTLSINEGDTPSTSIMTTPNISPDRSSYSHLLPQSTFCSSSNVINKEDVLKDTMDPVYRGYIDGFKVNEDLELGTESTVVLDELAFVEGTEWYVSPSVPIFTLKM
jgi:hypothetical protein